MNIPRPTRGSSNPLIFQKSRVVSNQATSFRSPVTLSGTYSHKVKSEKRSIDLNDQVSQTHNLLQKTIPKMIEIDLILEENLKRVDADPVQIEQALLNLVSNARVAMPDGGRLVIKT